MAGLYGRLDSSSLEQDREALASTGVGMGLRVSLMAAVWKITRTCPLETPLRSCPCIWSAQCVAGATLCRLLPAGLCLQASVCE